MINKAEQLAQQMLADLIRMRTGLEYAGTRLDLMRNRLAPLMAEHGFDLLLDYYYYLKYDAGAKEEWIRVQSALAVSESYFWREYNQIDAAVSILVPMLQRERRGKPVRIWHAASESGEEPYTLAIALEEAGRFTHGPIEIVGTDFNVEALERANTAIYRKRSFRSIPNEIFSRHFIPLQDDCYRLDDTIKSRVHFSYLNLVNEQEIASMRNYDIIFCRNVFIYFAESTIKQVVGGLYHSLNSSGILFVAAAESLLRLTYQFELVEIGNAFGYKKRILPGDLS